MLVCGHFPLLVFPLLKKNQIELNEISRQIESNGSEQNADLNKSK